ncbi:MAG: type II secretion system protein GspJ [Phycisphaerae bacterium]
MTRRSGYTGGFTLLEMLVATAIMATLAMSLYASLQIALRGRTSALASVETARKMNQSFELIKTDVQSALISKASAAAGAGSTSNTTTNTLAIGFIGRSAKSTPGLLGDDLVMCASAVDIEPDTGIGDIKQIEYSCEQAPDTGELSIVRRITTNLLAPVTPVARMETICRGVKTFMLQYYDGQTWQDAWDSTAQGSDQTGILPKAVAVTIELQPPPSKAGLRQLQENATYAATRVILVPCAQDSTASTSGGGQ